MGWFKKKVSAILPNTEYKIVTKSYVVKGKQIIVYLNNGDEIGELVKDHIYFQQSIKCNILGSEYSDIIYRRLQGDSVALKNVGSGDDILIPKTSILKLVVGPEQVFETIEVYSRSEKL